MSKATPTSRTLAHLRKLGYLAQVVEQRLPHCFITRDLFGCIDIVGVKADDGVIGIQCTSGANVAARLTKAVALPELRVWLAAGCKFEVWGWRQIGARGKLKRWDVARRPVVLADLPAMMT